MNIEIGPGRAGDPVLYIDNYPVAEVFDVDRMNVLLQRLEIAQKALEGVINVIHVQGVNRDIGNQSQWDEALLYKVKEALNQLKE